MSGSGLVLVLDYVTYMNVSKYITIWFIRTNILCFYNT